VVGPAPSGRGRVTRAKHPTGPRRPVTLTQPAGRGHQLEQGLRIGLRRAWNNPQGLSFVAAGQAGGGLGSGLSSRGEGGLGQVFRLSNFPASWGGVFLGWRRQDHPPGWRRAPGRYHFVSRTICPRTARKRGKPWMMAPRRYSRKVDGASNVRASGSDDKIQPRRRGARPVPRVSPFRCRARCRGFSIGDSGGVTSSLPGAGAVAFRPPRC